jgi:hypothetical protein
MKEAVPSGVFKALCRCAILGGVRSSEELIQRRRPSTATGGIHLGVL